MSNMEFHAWTNRTRWFCALSDVFVFHLGRLFAGLALALPYDASLAYIQTLCSWLKKCMWSLHAEQTCQIDQSQFQPGYELVQNGQGTQCRITNSFKLYAVTTDERTCDLQCKNGWYETETPPTMSCVGKDDQTSASGDTSFSGCERKWRIINGSHNGIVCRIGDLLRCFDR